MTGRHPTNHRQELLLKGRYINTKALRDDIPDLMADTIDAMLNYRTYERPSLEVICHNFEQYI